MKIEQVGIDTVIPYEFNARHHPEEQINRIANSINEFGFNQPIVIDESNIVLVGHGRLAAAKKLGLKTIPVLRKEDLGEAEKKAYRIIDNKLTDDSSWLTDNLNLDLEFLEDQDFDLEPWGLKELILTSISGKEINEDIGEGVAVCICPNCSHEHAKKE